MRILVVEDELQIQRQLQQALHKQTYAVDVASDGREGLFMGQEIDYDLAIIDIGLPNISGIELIISLRKSQRHFPILILTARNDWQDKVEGLEAGADDYVAKPFHMAEILARVNALLRRSAGHSSSIMNFGPLVIDTSAKRVEVNKNVLTLTSYEYNTLVYLCHHAGEVVSKSVLTDHLYDQDFDRDSNVIEVFVGRLRKKIDPNGDLKPIVTVRGQGYRFDLIKPESNLHG